MRFPLVHNALPNNINMDGKKLAESFKKLNLQADVDKGPKLSSLSMEALGGLTMRRGKYKGQTVKHVFLHDQKYALWVVTHTNPSDRAWGPIFEYMKRQNKAMKKESKLNEDSSDEDDFEILKSGKEKTNQKDKINTNETDGGTQTGGSTSSSDPNPATEARLANMENVLMQMAQYLNNQALEQRPSQVPAQFPDNAEEMS